jgi:hypothetical protein
MALPNVEITHAHAMKIVIASLGDKGKDALPEGLEATLKTISEARLAPNAANRFDSLPADMAKGKLKADQRMVDDIGGKLEIEELVNTYDNVISAMLKTNGYGTGRGAA